MELGYHLLDSLYIQLICRITMLSEELNTMGLSETECSRIRQNDRYIGRLWRVEDF
jgi:hypothetical protein